MTDDPIADALKAVWSGKDRIVLSGFRADERLEDAYDHHENGGCRKLSVRARRSVVKLFRRFPSMTVHQVDRRLLLGIEDCGRKTTREILDWASGRIGDFPADTQ